MNVNYKIPFYSNTPDNIHCVQASMKMVQEYFQPELKLSFDEWDKITCHKPGLWTWTMAGLMWFKKKGYEVIDIEYFDYKRFSEEGEKYILDFAGEEVGMTQIKYSDIPQEIEISKDFVKEVRPEVRIPTLKDVRSFLKDGFLVICAVNAHALYKEAGYSGHVVVVKGCTDSSLILHDPGLPPNEDFEVSDNVFFSAWAYPDEKAPNLAALKLNNSK